jgi:hypothetical protein
MVPMVRQNQGQARDRQLFSCPYILLLSSYMFFSYPYILLLSSYVFFLSLYFAFTQIVTDALSNKHAHVTMGYF